MAQRGVEGFGTVSGSDSPQTAALDSSCMRRRDSFVQEVANTIDARHGDGLDSFVFGLSGRWGEGKTHFLDQLTEPLEAKGFEIIHLNPWKFSGDRVAFLRSFLVELVTTQPWRSRVAVAWACLKHHRFADAVSAVEPRRTLAGLRTDVSRQRVAWVSLLLLLAVIATAFWTLTVLLSAKGWALPDSWRLPLILLFVPIVVALVQGSVRSQVTNRAAVALDEFDALSNLALGICSETATRSKANRRVVVFVDDLDRVTADVQRDVLDNLRTFFDKPALTFVVTGDYTVLESSLGRELAPGVSEAEKREQGRQFLKKIFNVYWRLPLPVQSDFESFVDAQLRDHGEEIETLIVGDEDRQRLRELLLGYSDLNLRQVIRTLDNLFFCLRLVRAQLANATDPGERASLQEIVANPMLLARVLMIQDRCAPLFDLFALKPSLLRDLDLGVAEAKELEAGGDKTDAVAAFLDGPEGSSALADRLSPEQRRFLTDFAYVPPLFYDLDKGGQVVRRDLGPWLHLAGDVSFGDESGPRPGDFARTLTTLNREGLVAQIERCSEAGCPLAVAAGIEALSGMTDAEERSRALLLLVGVCTDADSSFPLAERAAVGVWDGLEPLVSGLSDPTRVSVLVAVARLAERWNLDSPPDLATPAWVFKGVADLQELPREAYGPLASLMVLGWLTTYYGQNPADCLSHLKELLPCIDASQLENGGDSLGQRLVDDLLPDGDASHRTTRLGLIVNQFPAQADVVRRVVFDQLERPDVWEWAMSVAQDGTAPWADAQLGDSLIAWVNGLSDANDLMRRLSYAVGRLDSRSAALWQRLEEEHPGELADLLDRLAQEASLAPLVIPTEVSTCLYEKRAAMVRLTDDDSQAVQLAQILDPDRWLWSALHKKRGRKSLQHMVDRRAKRKQLQALLRPFWEQLGSSS